jgi:hypothetical protein
MGLYAEPICLLVFGNTMQLAHEIQQIAVQAKQFARSSLGLRHACHVRAEAAELQETQHAPCKHKGQYAGEENPKPDVYRDFL